MEQIDSIINFERIVRKTYLFTEESVVEEGIEHSFSSKNIHPKFPLIVKKLFDDGYYSQATFEAFKFLDKKVQDFSNESESGYKLMMKVFSDNSPLINLTPCSTVSEKDEQKGYQFIFAGSLTAIRNPRGHEHSISDSLDTCLDHLSLCSLLLRRLEEAGCVIS